MEAPLGSLVAACVKAYIAAAVEVLPTVSPFLRDAANGPVFLLVRFL